MSKVVRQMADVLRHIRERARSALIALFGFSLIINLLALSGSLFMLQVYDRVLTSRSVPTLLVLLAIVVVLFAFQGVLETLRMRMVARLGRGFDEALSKPVFDITTRMAQAGADQRKLDPMRDLDTLRQFIASPAVAGLFDIVWMPVFLIVLFLFHPALFALTLAGAILVLAMTLIGEMKAKHEAQKLNDLAIERQGFIDGARRNSEILTTMNLRERLAGHFGAVNAHFMQLQQKGGDFSAANGALVRMIRMLLQSLLLALSAYLAIKGEISAGTIIAGTILGARALAPVEQIVSQIRLFGSARLAYRRLAQALAVPHPAEPETHLPFPVSDLRVENLIMAAPGSTKILLQGLTFTLEKGDGLAVIGPSGSGKTTLARALVGALEPGRGQVLLDGAPIDQYPGEDRGRIISYLPQDVQLFAGTIAQNIARFEPNYRDEDVVSAAKAANVHDLVLNLPHGYDTILGEGGSPLSGGQRQRIGLARALYGEPFLAVLDEPYANLDGEGEKALNEAVLSIRKRGGIVVVIAHRRTAVAAVNKVMIIEAGRKTAFGERDAVLADLMRRQARPNSLTATPIAPRQAGASND